jgi:coniferyl-aldehyde dehydrogenase
MIKASEVTPRTAERLHSLVADAFPAEEVAVVMGDAAVAAEFGGLPFDHPFITGAAVLASGAARRARR